MSKVLVRYGSLVAVKREKARMETVIRQALVSGNHVMRCLRPNVTLRRGKSVFATDPY